MVSVLCVTVFTISHCLFSRYNRLPIVYGFFLNSHRNFFFFFRTFLDETQDTQLFLEDLFLDKMTKWLVCFEYPVLRFLNLFLLRFNYPLITQVLFLQISQFIHSFFQRVPRRISENLNISGRNAMGGRHNGQMVILLKLLPLRSLIALLGAVTHR